MCMEADTHPLIRGSTTGTAVCVERRIRALYAKHYRIEREVGTVLYLNNHVCRRSSVVTDGDPVPLHHLVQGSKKRVPLLHFPCSLFCPTDSNK